MMEANVDTLARLPLLTLHNAQWHLRIERVVYQRSRKVGYFNMLLLQPLVGIEAIAHHIHAIIPKGEFR